AQTVDAHPGLLVHLSRYDYKSLLVIHTLYAQQRQMHSQRVHTVADRIVSISQPHVRPIVRGKAGKRVEFGAKLSISHQRGGYVSVDTLRWDAYNESADLPPQIESYKERFGYYPSSVHADTIYRTRANRTYCKERGIRLSGKPLGRPKKATAENAEELKAQKRLERQDELDRIPVEGKFGNAKRKGTLGRIMAKLAPTSESVIHVGIIVLNLNKWLTDLLLRLLPVLRSIACALSIPFEREAIESTSPNAYMRCRLVA
ncbi:MAG: transposase, partial [Oscillatoria sp. SIO1A7]|nr:transposase [Oscillatoria sp. SIO1A7]